MRVRCAAWATTSTSCTAQVVGAGAVDPGGGVGARAQRRPGPQVHELVLTGARHETTGVAAVRALHDHLFHAADPGPVGRQRRALHHHPEALEALGHDLRGDEALHHLGGFGAGAGAVHEGVGAVVGSLGHYLQRGDEVGFGLAREADDHVGGYCQVGDRPASGREAIEVAGGVVATVHRRQHPVAARLQGQVEVLAHRWGLGHGRDRLGVEILGVRAGVPDPADALHRAHGAQQVGEPGSQRTRPGLTPGCEGEIPAVAVHVLPQQGDLADALSRQGSHLGHDVARGTGDLATAHRGHDAEGAAVVATDLDGDPAGPRHRPARWQSRGEGGLIGLGDLVDDLDHRGARAPRHLDQLGRPSHVVRAEDHIDVPEALHDGLAVLLGQAPADHDLHLGPGRLEGLEVPEVAVELVVGVLADAAGVEHHHVGVVEAMGGLEAVGGQQTLDALRVVLVHLAPEGAHEEAAWPGHARQVRGRPGGPSSSS